MDSWNLLLKWMGLVKPSVEVSGTGQSWYRSGQDWLHFLWEQVELVLLSVEIVGLVKLLAEAGGWVKFNGGVGRVGLSMVENRSNFLWVPKLWVKPSVEVGGIGKTFCKSGFFLW